MENIKKTLVVVDDEENIRSALKELLQENYRIYQASDGREAIELINRVMPDLVLLDILMPELDGYQVCAMLKKDRRTTHIPVIFLSAKAQISDTEKGFNVGADAYISKPFSSESLMEKISNVLEKSEIRNSISGDGGKNSGKNT